MLKKLREELEVRYEWLNDENVNYPKEAFRDDWRRYTKAIEEVYYLGLISDKVHDDCKAELMGYMKDIL